MKPAAWIDVDLRGLETLLARRSKAFVVHELLQNAWDERCTIVEVILPRPRHGRTRLVVTDDSPTGFHDLSHAFTLFAESRKKGNVRQRGTFNAGEKFVLALCDEAEIVSTTGGVVFDAGGRRRIRRRTEQGSRFSGLLRLTIEEWEQVYLAVRRLIPPVTTMFNGEKLAPRKPLRTFSAILPTVEADAEGNLRRTARKTEVSLYEPHPGETATLYEMGLPVVSTSDKWHIDIQQKVPVNMERDNVSPSYLQSVRLAVLNEMAHLLTGEDATSTWVRQAAGDSRIKDRAFNSVIGLRFGDKRVTYDPSDPEANLIAVSKGYSVIAPASLSGDEWQNVRRFRSSLPAGRVTPSPKPFSSHGSPLRLLEGSKKTAAHAQFEAFAGFLGVELIGRSISVVFANDPGWGFGGCYGKGELTINVHGRGRVWFHGSPGGLLEKWIPFLIHEFAHHKVRGHLTEDYHRECCRLAGVLACIMYEKPNPFRELKELA